MEQIQITKPVLGKAIEYLQLLQHYLESLKQPPIGLEQLSELNATSSSVEECIQSIQKALGLTSYAQWIQGLLDNRHSDNLTWTEYRQGLHKGDGVIVTASVHKCVAMIRHTVKDALGSRKATDHELLTEFCKVHKINPVVAVEEREPEEQTVPPTCTRCNREVRPNVPRLGFRAGAIHTHSDSIHCYAHDKSQTGFKISTAPFRLEGM
jgi:hypothetical protein